MVEKHQSFKATILGLAGLVSLLALGLVGCSEEQENKLSRIAVHWFEGSYDITFANGSHTQTWYCDGKVTSEPSKGYYYFWTRDKEGKKRYVQTPIENTYIVEVEKR